MTMMNAALFILGCLSSYYEHAHTTGPPHRLPAIVSSNGFTCPSPDTVSEEHKTARDSILYYYVPVEVQAGPE